MMLIVIFVCFAIYRCFCCHVFGLRPIYVLCSEKFDSKCINCYLEHVIETDYHAPPVGDFGYGRSGMMDTGFRDTFESWETSGAGGYSMNAMFADGGMATDYELSNINSISMTPNGKYAIVGQSQGPPQIWDAVVKII